MLVPLVISEDTWFRGHLWLLQDMIDYWVATVPRRPQQTKLVAFRSTFMEGGFGGGLRWYKKEAIAVACGWDFATT